MSGCYDNERMFQYLKAHPKCVQICLKNLLSVCVSHDFLFLLARFTVALFSSEQTALSLHHYLKTDLMKLNTRYVYTTHIPYTPHLQFISLQASKRSICCISSACEATITRYQFHKNCILTGKTQRHGIPNYLQINDIGLKLHQTPW